MRYPRIGSRIRGRTDETIVNTPNSVAARRNSPGFARFAFARFVDSWISAARDRWFLAAQVSRLRRRHGEGSLWSTLLAFQDSHEAPTLRRRQRAGLHQRHAIADAGVPVLVVGLDLLRGPNDLAVQRVHLAVFELDHDGLLHLVADDVPDDGLAPPRAVSQSAACASNSQSSRLLTGGSVARPSSRSRSTVDTGDFMHADGCCRAARAIRRRLNNLQLDSRSRSINSSSPRAAHRHQCPLPSEFTPLASSRCLDGQFVGLHGQCGPGDLFIRVAQLEQHAGRASTLANSPFGDPLRAHAFRRFWSGAVREDDPDPPPRLMCRLMAIQADSICRLRCRRARGPDAVVTEGDVGSPPLAIPRCLGWCCRGARTLRGINRL